MYFKDFPNLLYDFNYATDSKTSVVKDITRNVRFRKEIFNSITIYDEYDILDGETPEIIAERIYGNAEYHWVIMVLNDKYSYINDFPMEENSLVKHMQSIYGETISGIHHYEDANGFVVNQTVSGAAPVTNEEYERRINESKRRIKLISPDLLKVVLKNYKELL